MEIGPHCSHSVQIERQQIKLYLCFPCSLLKTVRSCSVSQPTARRCMDVQALAASSSAPCASVVHARPHWLGHRNLWTCKSPEIPFSRCFLQDDYVFPWVDLQLDMLGSRPEQVIEGRIDIEWSYLIVAAIVSTCVLASTMQQAAWHNQYMCAFSTWSALTGKPLHVTSAGCKTQLQ